MVCLRLGRRLHRPRALGGSGWRGRHPRQPLGVPRCYLSSWSLFVGSGMLASRFGGGRGGMTNPEVLPTQNLAPSPQCSTCLQAQPAWALQVGRSQR